MVKIIHTGDVHIGKQFKNFSDCEYGKNRRIDILSTFINIVKMAKESEVDILLVAGDLFDEDTCELSDIELINSEFKKLTKTNVLICAGNHDPIDEDSYYRLVNWSKNVYIFDNCNGIEHKDFPDINLAVYSVSWNTKERKDDILKSINIDNYDRINILMLHGDLENKESKYLPLDKNELQSYGFEYIALGHIHKPTMYSDKMCYSGSPEPLDFGETSEHGVIKTEVSKQMTTTKFASISKRRYHIIEIEIDENMNKLDIVELIKNEISDLGKEDIYRVKLTGIKNSLLKFNLSSFKDEFIDYAQFIQFIDETKNNYDLVKLRENNKHNMVGLFIEEMMRKDLNNPIVKDALNIGLELLLDEKVKIK
ncbi:DNA repair exonuclease [Clostridiaceae bacterium M8S5]|nr:DNA repair exonuclease [Clostridiaceae bacterium M8S5]